MSDHHNPVNHKIGAFELALLIFTLLLFCAYVIDTALVLPKEVSNLIHIVDTLACAIFFGDFCYRFYQAESKGTFLKWGWIDLVACIPNLEIFRWGRLVRVLRIIRILRGIRSIQKALSVLLQERMQTGAVSLAFSAFLLVAFSSFSILVCEAHAGGSIKTAQDAVWWSISTITTVGYGDMVPVTTEGRLLAMILMVAGVGMFGGLSGLAASFFLGSQDRNSGENKEILARLDQLQAALQALNQKQQASGPSEDLLVARR